MTRLPSLDRVDPWRFECPSCGSFELHTLHRRSKRADRDYRFDGIGKKCVQQDRNATYRCGECNSRSNHVYDKKKGRLVRQV